MISTEPNLLKSSSPYIFYYSGWLGYWVTRWVTGSWVTNKWPMVHSGANSIKKDNYRLPASLPQYFWLLAGGVDDKSTSINVAWVAHNSLCISDLSCRPCPFPFSSAVFHESKHCMVQASHVFFPRHFFPEWENQLETLQNALSTSGLLLQPLETLTPVLLIRITLIFWWSIFCPHSLPTAAGFQTSNLVFDGLDWFIDCILSKATFEFN